MKLVRYRLNGEVKAGVVVGDGVASLRSLDCPCERILDLVAAGPDALARLRDALANATPEAMLDEVELLAPIERPGKYLAIGMNYGKHLEEADRLGVPRSKHQVWFNKQTSCLNDPFAPVRIGNSEQLDYEVELGVVIGQSAKDVSVDAAPAHIFGYFVANDFSARDYQFHSATMTIGKSFDTHGPIGPWIVTADEIADPHGLDVKCWVNGELRQSNNSGGMIANVWQQISYLSSAFTLDPGDLIATGTPEGVGIAMDPPQFLKQGDVVRCEVEGIGAIENIVVP